MRRVETFTHITILTNLRNKGKEKDEPPWVLKKWFFHSRNYFKMNKKLILDRVWWWYIHYFIEEKVQFRKFNDINFFPPNPASFLLGEIRFLLNTQKFTIMTQCSSEVHFLFLSDSVAILFHLFGFRKFISWTAYCILHSISILKWLDAAAVAAFLLLGLSRYTGPVLLLLFYISIYPLFLVLYDFIHFTKRTRCEWNIVTLTGEWEHYPNPNIKIPSKTSTQQEANKI